MSYQSAKRVPLSKKKGLFSGGYVDNVQNIDMSPNFSPYSRNARLDGQSIIIRPGHELFATLTAGDYPRGIGSYLRTVEANDRIVVRHNKDADEKLVSIETDGTVTNINTGADIASDNRMSFQNVADVIYCMNGIDDFGKLSGTTYTTPNVGISDFSPSFSEVFNGCHRASGWSDNPNVVYKSVGDNYEDFNSAGSDTFTFKETNTGLRASDQALFYFTKNTISLTGKGDIEETSGSITYYTRPMEVTEGSENNECIVSTGSIVYFLTSSNKINFLEPGNTASGFKSSSLSHRKYAGIDNIMATLDDDQSDGFAYYLPKENLIKRHLKTEGASFNDICIIYDITKDAFLVDEQKYFYGGIFFKGVNYTISMIEEKVYKDEYSQTDEDTAIPFEYYTKEFYIDDPSYKKILWETRTVLDINELAELTQSIYINGALQDVKSIDKNNIDLTHGGIGTREVGVFSIGEEGDESPEYNETYILRTKGNLNKIGQKFQFRFTNSSLAGKVRLKHIQMKVEPKPGLASNLTT